MRAMKKRKRRTSQQRRTRNKSESQSRRLTEALVRAFRAVRRYRKGESKTLSAAASAEHTTVRNIRRLLPKALIQNRRGGLIGVTPRDRYSARVELFTGSGPLVVTARGSRERELAGRHRATVMRVLSGQEPPSALDQFRGKSVGGHALIADYDLLSEPATAGALDQLDSLYVAPDASS